MMKKLTVRLELTSGQYEVLGMIAQAKGDEIPTYIHDALIYELEGEVDHLFTGAHSNRDDYFQKLGVRRMVA